MKKILSSILVLNFGLIFAQNEISVDKNFKTSDRIVSEVQIFDWVKKQYKLNENESFAFVSRFEDDLGQVHEKYSHKVNGIPVLGSTIILHWKNSTILSLNGKLYKTEYIKENISEEVALKSALMNINAKTYYWDLEGEEKLLKEMTSNANATYRPKGKLLFAPSEGNFQNIQKLSYEFEIYSKIPEGRWSVYVDASNGEVVWKLNNLHTSEAHGLAVTKYNDTVNIITDSISPTQFRLHDYSRGNGIITKNNQSSTSTNDLIDFIDTDNYWNNVNADEDEVAGDAHFGAEQSYDYFKTIHNRNSYNNNGAPINVYVHYDEDLGNAEWNGYRLAFGDGGSFASPFTVIDIVGHELAHGVTEYTAGLVYSYESGALNESFSDIFGVAIDAYTNPTSYNYLMGEQTGNTIRNMANPNEYGNPDTYLGDSWYTGSGDNGGVHYNSGVQNFWFYLLAEGGSGTNDNGDDYIVEGLGIEDAAKIAYRNLSVYLTQSSNYEDARKYSIKAAIDLHGECSYEVKQVTNAWYAVGIGEPYDSVVTANFVMSKSFACEFPAYLDLTNMSTNGTTYEWLLPNDNTSDTKNVSFNIDEPGTYDITLVVSNEVKCFVGPDTLTKTVQFIQINAPLTLANCAPENTSFCCQVGVTNFKLNDINRTTGDASEGYQDYTCNANTILQVGKDYDFEVTVGTQIAEVIKMYIDLNNDGVFDFKNELMDSLYAIKGTKSSKINVPKNTSNIYNKPLRLRLMTDVLSKSKFGPCDVLSKGQAEDYTVVLVESENFTLGINEVEEADFSVYPNPTSSAIDIVSETKFNKVLITDITGRSIYKKDLNSTISHSIDISNYQNGVYFVRLTNDEGQFRTQKIIKQ